MPPDAAVIEPIRIRDIPGGIHPPDNKAQSLRQPIAEAPLPEQVTLPLSRNTGTPAKPDVEVGERVKTGQLIATGQGPVSANIHASISGIVTAIEDRPVPHPSGMSALCIVIDSDGKDEWVNLEETVHYRDHDAGELTARIRSAGVAGLGGTGFPTAVKLTPEKPARTLIINGAECEPYITSDQILMRERPAELIEGIRLLAYILGEPEQILIGIEDTKPDAVAAVQEAADASGDQRVRVCSFPAKYPTGGEKQLIQILTGHEVPTGGLPSNLGIVVHNIGTVLAAWDAVRWGKPLICRITTCTGEALRDQRNFNVRMGTPVGFLLKHVGLDRISADRIVMGGPMMGFSVRNEHTPVTEITNCLLVPTQEELPSRTAAQPCIRCGICAEVCPVGLLPQQLFWYAQAEDDGKLEDYNLFDCIECGACAYVCPSSIPLVHYYRAAKGRILESAREKIKSDRARERFEYHQLRVEREAAERETKRRARGEAAQTKNPEQINQTGASSTIDDAVARAMQRVQQTQNDPEKTRHTLERRAQTFRERIDDLETRIGSAGTPEQKAKLEASQKNTRKKLEAVRRKLAELATETAQSGAGSPSPHSEDATAAAIAHAQETSQTTVVVSTLERAEARLKSLQEQHAQAVECVRIAGAEGSDTLEDLQSGLNAIETDLEKAEKELRDLSAGEADA